MDHSTPNSSDPILLHYLQTPGEADAKRLLETILTDHALPILRSIQADKFRDARGEGRTYQKQEADEFLDETLGRIAVALALCWSDPARTPIDDFASYVATVGYNGFSDYVRRKHPKRAALANQVNVELDKHPALARWKLAVSETLGRRDEWHGGLKRWRDEGRAPVPSAALLSFLANPRAWAMDALPDDDPRTTDLARQLETIFRRVQTPVFVTRLVAALCKLREVEDQVLVQSFDASSTSSDDPVHRAWDRRAIDDYFESPHNNPGARAELRHDAAHLWAEIQQLPRRQRVALLLQMRDDHGGAGIHHFPEAGVASLRELAAAMELPVETLAECWDRLPFEDTAIASLLGATSVQVSSLRKCARERLSRRTEIG